MELKILTFNWHAPYIHLLSKTGHQWFVVEPEIRTGKVKCWEHEMRPLPSNARLVSEDDAVKILEEGNIDLVLAHNIKDLILTKGFIIPKILVFHNRLSTEIGLAATHIDRNDYLNKIATLREGVHEVYISESKRNDWGGSGELILPGIDLEEYGGYTGENATALRIGNHFKERDLMLGFTSSQKIIHGFPCHTLGINPSLPGTNLAKNFNELKDFYQKSRLYINTTKEAFEDGYNLSMLEAMATGMPIISLSNLTSPIKNGENGFISNDISYLRKCVEKLLNDPKLAIEIGQNARKTIIKKFGLQQFLNKWNEVIKNTVLDFLRESGVSISENEEPFYKKEKKNILMDFSPCPGTVAYYLERALRKKHNVITCGAKHNGQIYENEMKDFFKLNNPIPNQDFLRKADDPIFSVLEHLPRGWKPDIYFWVETGLDNLPKDLDSISIPKACYLIDSNLRLESHLALARHFDFIFLAQKKYLESFRNVGCHNVFWLPMACDPEIHGKQEVEKKYEVSFVGSLNEKRRQDLLQIIDRKFDLFVGGQYLNEKATVFAKSKIIFNNAVSSELNMRVFEALCSGSLLLTNPVLGLNEFFSDSEHLVVYNNTNEMERKIRYYLDHPKERFSVGEMGRNEVLTNHTYDHRVSKMITLINDHLDNLKSYDKQLHSLPASRDCHINDNQEELVSLVPSDVKCLLDVGCGVGAFGEAIKKKKKIFVAGIEKKSAAAKEAKKILDDVVEGNIETIDLPYEGHCFDFIILADILQQIIDPKLALEKLRKCLSLKGTLVVRVPNVQFLGIVSELVEGRWTYQNDGILQHNNLRFYTRQELQKLFDAAGFEITSCIAKRGAQFNGLECDDPSILKIGKITLKDITPFEMDAFLAQHFIVLAKPKKIFEETKEIGQKVNINNMELILKEARNYESNNELKKALKIYNSLLDNYPDSTEVLTCLANCNVKNNKNELARTYFKKALDIDPLLYSALMGQALLNHIEKRYYEAIEDFDKILSNDSSHHRALCGKAMSYEMLGLMDLAYENYSKSLDINIENYSSMMGLLKLSYELKKFNDAERFLKEYLQRHPANLNILFGLAGILYKNGKEDDAIDKLNKILLFDPNHKNALDMIEKINLSQLST